MKLALKNDFPIALNAKVMYLVVTDIYKNANGVPMADVQIDIQSEERFEIEEVELFNQNGESQGVVKVLGNKVPISNPYQLQRLTDLPGIPYELVSAVVGGSVDTSILAGVNYAIDQAGFNSLFHSSMEGFKIEIENVIFKTKP